MENVREAKRAKPGPKPSAVLDYFEEVGDYSSSSKRYARKCKFINVEALLRTTFPWFDWTKQPLELNPGQKAMSFAVGDSRPLSQPRNLCTERRTTMTTLMRPPLDLKATHSCILEGFRVYRSLAKTVFLLEKQQRQDSSPSGRRLTEYASMFGGEPATEQRIAEMVDDLNSRAIVDLADLAHLEPRVVLQRNEPRHTLNTRLIMLEAQRKNQRLVVWNVDHVPVQKRGAAAEPALTHVEKAVAMRIKDHEFGHTTADTWYYHGARYILLDTTAADAGASHNNEVEACGLLEDGREPADDSRGPYRRLKYLPAAVIVRPISGHIPGTVLQGLADYASRGGAFILSPRASCIAEVDMPAAGYGTITKQIRRLNVPLGDRQAVTDYFVQGRSFKDECWLVDLAVPPNGIKRATLYVLLTRFKMLDHVRLLRPLYTTPHERKRIIKQFLSMTNLEPDLAANLRLLKQAARDTEHRYTAEFQHARQLEACWTPSAQS
ncbi:hypothetical protein VOLCADRAFT_107527 [Volvox carteri f. nagariensis]|uniref:Uncharacterized protein n=1 Tax=Volvox carteri f. nagariensis TaxID=3068 RepID=D8UEM0_VOLCA|nr:uncharacterized protein VOLCADRAFT_107527 [Volvox carteri f. nagariensis]EFJ41908.1 hypothetical protein VOLCADRAFT_107527 [Volvox carteri f. nagariensis]|eukprot:XP_002957106.1 hypothetical protein VOLCADRAFT_107527 [Volvox carteri f. nagariensis]